MLFTERMPATRVNQIQHPGPLYPNSMTVTSGIMITTPPSLPFITVHCCLLSGIEHVRVWQGCEFGGEEAVLLLPEVNSRELTALADLLYHGRLVPQRSIIFNNCF